MGGHPGRWCFRRRLPVAVEVGDRLGLRQLLVARAVHTSLLLTTCHSVCRYFCFTLSESHSGDSSKRTAFIHGGVTSNEYVESCAVCPSAFSSGQSDPLYLPLSEPWRV